VVTKYNIKLMDVRVDGRDIPMLRVGVCNA
jgi:hypothetical protein